MIKYLKIVFFITLWWVPFLALTQDTIPLNTTYAFEANYVEGYTYSWWFTNDAGVITELESTTNKTEAYYWDTEGEFQILVQAKDDIGCLSEIIFKDYVVADMAIDLIVSAGNDTTIGSGISYQLNASVSDTTGLTYLWGPADALDDATILNPVFTPGETTRFILTVSEANGNKISDNVVITVSEIIANAGEDVFMEDGARVQLDGSASIGAELQYLWTATNGVIESGENTANPIVSSVGVYYLSVTDLYGSTSTDSVLVRDGGTSSPIVYAGNDTIIGSGISYQLNASVSDTTGLTYLWGPADGLDDVTILNPVFTPGETTSFILTVSEANGNQILDTVVITVSEIIANAGEDAVIEDGAMIELDGSASIGEELQYIWTTTNGVIESGENTANPIVSSVGVYYLSVIDFYGSTSTDSVLVIDGGTSLPIVYAGNDTIIGTCNPYQLQASVSDTTGLTYLWEPGNNLNDPTILDPIFTPGETTIFILTVSQTLGMKVRDTVTIEVDDFYANAGQDFVMEAGTTALLDGTGSEGEQLQYLWSTENGSIESGQNTATAIISSPGTYLLQIEDYFGCRAFDSVVVSLLTYAPVAVDDYDTTHFQTAVRIPVLANDYDPDGVLDPTSLSIQQYPLNGNVYINYDDNTLTYTPNDGFAGNDVFEYQICDLIARCDNAYVFVTVVQLDFFVPQAFTPNGDNINDFFEIVGIEAYENNSINIVNRWGKQVYAAKNYGIDTAPKYWDGTWQKNGGDVPTGTYFYILDLGNGQKPIAGSVYIDR